MNALCFFQSGETATTIAPGVEAGFRWNRVGNVVAIYGTVGLRLPWLRRILLAVWPRPIPEFPAPTLTLPDDLRGKVLSCSGVAIAADSKVMQVVAMNGRGFVIRADSTATLPIRFSVSLLMASV